MRPVDRTGTTGGHPATALSGVVAAVLAAALLGGCSFDYSGGSVERRDTGPVPQVELLGVDMVVVRDNRLELSADRIASYPDEGYQEFSGMVFREYGPLGELRLEGEAERGILYLDTENVELRGTVRFYSTVEGATIESGMLSWDAAERVLTAPGDQSVRLTRDDGSWLEGYGMEVDGRRNSVEFSAGVEGTFQDGRDRR